MLELYLILFECDPIIFALNIFQSNLPKQFPGQTHGREWWYQPPIDSCFWPGPSAYTGLPRLQILQLGFRAVVARNRVRGCPQLAVDAGRSLLKPGRTLPRICCQGLWKRLQADDNSTQVPTVPLDCPQVLAVRRDEPHAKGQSQRIEKGHPVSLPDVKGIFLWKP